jgi:hypothetical protein
MRRSAIWTRYPFQEGKIVFSMIWRRDIRNGPEEFSRLTIVRINRRTVIICCGATRASGDTLIK